MNLDEPHAITFPSALGRSTFILGYSIQPAPGRPLPFVEVKRIYRKLSQTAWRQGEAGMRPRVVQGRLSKDRSDDPGGLE